MPQYKSVFVDGLAFRRMVDNIRFDFRSCSGIDNELEATHHWRINRRGASVYFHSDLECSEPY